MNQQLQDSGKRRQFKSGAQRDRGNLKPRPDLISPHAQMREGMIFALGAEKYDVRNWELGMPVSECLASAQRHIEQYKRGDTDEDHLAQARWNLGAILHYEEEILSGRMDPAIDDMPHYADQIQRPQSHVPIVPCTEPVPDIIRYQWDTIKRARPLFYICGPMTGIDKFNFPAFDRARDRGIRMGYNIISPADLDREAGINENSPSPTTPVEMRAIVKRDLDVIQNQLKAERGDGLALLAGWPGSTGASAEIFTARWLRLQIVDARDFRTPIDVLTQLFYYQKRRIPDAHNPHS